MSVDRKDAGARGDGGSFCLSRAHRERRPCLRHQRKEVAQYRRRQVSEPVDRPSGSNHRHKYKVSGER